MRITQMEESINEEKRKCAEHIQEREKEYQNYHEQLKARFEKEKSNFSKLLQEKEKESLDHNTRNQDLLKELQKWKNTAHILKNGKKDKEQQAINAMKQLDETENSYKEKLQREKLALKSQYEKLNQQLKDKNAELFNLHQKILDELQSNEEKLRTVTQEKAKLDAINQTLEAKMASLNEDLEREKKLQDSKI